MARGLLPRGGGPSGPSPPPATGGPMTTLLDRIDDAAAPDAPPATTDVTGPARRLRTTMAACRVQFTWFGTQKSLTPEQRALAAEAFDAEGPSLSAGKKLL